MKYFEVYFRIKSAYNYENGFAELQDTAAFNAEVAKVFTNDGWEIISGRSSGCAPTAKKAEQALYLHPMHFSGVIREESIEHLHSLLSAPERKAFTCYHVDVYDEYMDMTDEEYLSLLYSREGEIEAALLEKCRTKRKNLFAVGDIKSSTAKKFAVLRLGQRPGCDTENLVMDEVFQRLIRTGAIQVATTKSGVGYRTVAKKEAA